MTEVGEIVAKISADIREFEQKLEEAKKILDSLGQTAEKQQKSFRQLAEETSKSFKDIGKTLTTSITLPLVGVGTTATKIGMDFEDTMQKIVGLTGTSQEQVNKWAEDIKKLAPEIGKSPQELAEALYFIASAGIDASKAMDVLKAAAKASAAGLGETQVIADALTSAVNAYAQSGLTAEQATAILINTVKFGKAEANELAGSIGRVIPIAAQMGIKFEDVGAAIAAMTQTGLDTAEATTALRGVLTTLLNPTKEAEDALNALGLSSEQLRKQASEEGLLSVLVTLQKAFSNTDSIIAQSEKRVEEYRRGVEEAQKKLEKAKIVYGADSKEVKEAKKELKNWEKALKEAEKGAEKTQKLLGSGVAAFFGNVRALVGALSLTGENVGNVQEIFSQMAKTTPEELDKAFGAISETTQFAFNQAISQVKTSLLELSTTILPPLKDILKDVADAIKNVTNWFSGLDDNTKKTALTVATVFAATGPALLAIGGMIDTVTKLVDIFKTLGTVIASGSPLGIALAALAAAVIAYQTNFLGFRDAVNYVVDALTKYPSVISDLVNSISTYLENLKTEWEIKWNKFKQDVTNVWNDIKEVVSAKIEIVTEFMSDTTNAIKKWWNNIVKTITDFLSGQSISKSINIVIGFFSDVGGTIKSWWNSILLQIYQFIDKNTPDTIKKMLGLDFTIQIKQIKTEQFKEIGQKIGETLGDDIKNQLTKSLGTDWLADLRQKTIGKTLPAITQEVTKLFKQLKINVSQETIETVAKLLFEYNKLYKELVGHSIIPDLIEKMGHIFVSGYQEVIKETINFRAEYQNEMQKLEKIARQNAQRSLDEHIKMEAKRRSATESSLKKQAELEKEKTKEIEKEKQRIIEQYIKDITDNILKGFAEELKEAPGVLSIIGDYIDKLKIKVEAWGDSLEQVRISITNLKEGFIELAIEGIEKAAYAFAKLLFNIGKWGVEGTKWGESNLESFNEMVKNFEEWDENQRKLIELQKKQAGAVVGSAFIGGLIGAFFGPLGILIGAGLGALVGDVLGKTLDKQIEELKKKLADTFQKIKEFLGTTAGDIAGAMRKAFDSSTYTQFVKNFTTYLREMTRDALIKAFLAGELMKPLLDKISDLITSALLDASLTQEEIDAINAAITQATNAAAPFFEALKKLFPELAGTLESGPAGTQISEITGPTKDLLVSLLEPLGNLGNYFTSLKDVLIEIRDILKGVTYPVEIYPTYKIPATEVNIENLYIEANIEDLATWESFMRMVSEKARIATRAKGLVT